jgi:hypothetical protein
MGMTEWCGGGESHKLMGGGLSDHYHPIAPTRGHARADMCGCKEGGISN